MNTTNLKPAAATGTSAPTGPLQLTVIERDTIWIYPLPPQGTVSIGRDQGNSLRICDPAVSRKHALLHLGPTMRIERVSRTKKILVGFGRRPGDGGIGNWREVLEPIELRLGDSICIGSVELALRHVHAFRPFDGNALTVDEQDVFAAEDGHFLDAPGLLDVFGCARRLARSTMNATIVGEPGVGKKQLAWWMHRESERAPHPFKVVSCDTLKEELLECELFGSDHVSPGEDAQTGAFEIANGGTLFLDAIQTLSPDLQGRVQAAIEDKKVFRAGASRPRSVDVRVIAGAPSDLDLEVQRGGFRRGLAGALSGIVLSIPPLRERKNDIAPLARAFIRDACVKGGRSAIPVLSPEAQAALEQYDWPYNHTELRQAMTNAVSACADGTIQVQHIPLRRSMRPAPMASSDVMPTIPPCPPAPSRSAAEVLPMSRLTEVYRAAVDAGIEARDATVHLEQAFAAKLPTMPDRAEQLWSDLAELNRTAWLTDGTIPLLVWLAAAATLTRTTMAQQLFEAAQGEVEAALSKARLPQTVLLALRDAALTLKLDRTALLADIDPATTAKIAKRPNDSDQMLSDLSLLNDAGVVHMKRPIQTWLASAVDLAGPRVESHVFNDASSSLASDALAHSLRDSPAAQR